MAGQQARLPRPKRCPSARAAASIRPPGSPAPGSTPPGAPGPACARPAPGRTRTASMTRSPARPPLVAVRALRRVTPPGGPHVHGTIKTPVRLGRQCAVLPALIDRLGPARRGCAGKRTGRRYRSAALRWAEGPAGNHLRVPADRSREPVVPGGEVPGKMAPGPAPDAGQAARPEPARPKPARPEPVEPPPVPPPVPHRCRHRRGRNAGRSRGHCRRRNRNWSQYRTRSRSRSHCRRRRRQRSTRSAATPSPGGPVPAHDPRLSRRCTAAARSCRRHNGALILPGFTPVPDSHHRGGATVVVTPPVRCPVVSLRAVASVTAATARGHGGIRLACRPTGSRAAVAGHRGTEPYARHADIGLGENLRPRGHTRVHACRRPRPAPGDDPMTVMAVE
jgi:hypothetical protein